MTEVKKLGIWMCHSNVHLVEYTTQISEKEALAAKNVNPLDIVMQNEAFHMQTESFKKLGVAIEKYEEVILFGPVDAKVELLKFLRADARFEKIRIGVKNTNIMSEDEQHLFVEKFFSTH